MYLKPGVNISELCLELSDKLPALDRLHKEIFGREVRITSGHEGHDGDGVHSAGSLHYQRKAVDVGWTFKVCNLSDVGIYFSKLCTIFNSAEFDVLFEINHIHIEYDPT